MVRRRGNEWMPLAVGRIALVGCLLAPAFAVPDNAAATISLATGNFSTDTHADLAISVRTKQHVMVFLGDGLAGFSPTPTQTLTDFDEPRAVASSQVPADFNGDGLVDLAVASYGNRAVSVFLGVAPSGLETMPIATLSLAESATAVVTADFNEDGVLDLAVGTIPFEDPAGPVDPPPAPPTEGHVLIFLGVGDGAGHGTGQFTGPVTDLSLDIAQPGTAITSISSASCGTASSEMTIFGTLLLDGATVTIDDSADPLPIVSVAPDYTQMVVQLPPLTPPGTHTVTIASVGTATGEVTVLERVTQLGGFGSVSPPEVTYPVSGFPGGGAQVAVVSPSGGEFALGMTITVSSPTTTTQLSGETEIFTGFGCCVSAAQPFTHRQANMVFFWVPDGALAPGAYDISVSNNDVCGGADSASGLFSVVAQ